MNWLKTLFGPPVYGHVGDWQSLRGCGITLRLSLDLPDRGGLVEASHVRWAVFGVDGTCIAIGREGSLADNQRAADICARQYGWHIRGECGCAP